MYANYHTHTWRCGHASGSEREFVENAIEGGLRILGFSDHTPQFFEGDYYPDREKMRPEQLEGYVDTVLDLKREYASDIRILLGLEVEYYPVLFEKLLDFTAPYPFEFMILGQHTIGSGGAGDQSVFRPTDSEEVLKQYVRQCTEALETGRFLYFAHPDVLRFTGDAGVYRQEMRKLCIRAKELGIPVEINLLGLREGRHYPNPLFWEAASETGNTVVIGADAHHPEHVVVPEVIRRAEEMADQLGLTVIPEMLS